MRYRTYTMRDLGRFWTAANVLSLIRLVIVVPIAVLLWHDGPVSWVLGLVALGVLTDFMDGRVARWTKTVSEWGKVLDPFADKFAALAIGSVLTLRPVPELNGLPAPHLNLPMWLLGLIIVRDVLVFGGGVILAKRQGTVPPSVWTGKVAVGMLALTVLMVILRADAPVMQVLVWTTAGFFVLSFLQYLVRFAIVYRAPRHPLQEEPEVLASSARP